LYGKAASCFIYGVVCPTGRPAEIVYSV
jgi:hypothetical protein